MANAFANFYIKANFITNIQQVLNDVDNINKKIKEVGNVITTINNKQEDADKRHISNWTKIKKHVKSLSSTLLYASSRLSLISSAFGALTKLSFDNIKELVDNSNMLKENGERFYQLLNASGKVLNTSRANVANELNEIMQAKQESKYTGAPMKPEFMAFGTSINENLDNIIDKFRAKIKTMGENEGKVFAKKMGLSNIYEIARLNDEEYKKIMNLEFYNKQNIEKMQQGSKVVKDAMETLNLTKNTLLVQFSPLVQSFFSSLKNFVESNSFQFLAKSLAGAAEDITTFNNTLKGIPFKLLIGALTINAIAHSKVLQAGLLIGTAGGLFQEIWNFGKNKVLEVAGKQPEKQKEGILTNLFGYDDGRDVAKKDAVNKVNNTYNSTKNNTKSNAINTNIVVNINGSDKSNGRIIGNNVGNAVKKEIENNNKKMYNKSLL